MSICAICLSTPLTESASFGQLGKVDGCTHAFCFDCISLWTKESTTCPNCNALVSELTKCNSTHVLKRVTLNAVDHRQRSTFRVEELQAEAAALERCAVCHQEDDVEAIICDSCGHYHHLGCLSSSDAPRARFLCKQAVAAQEEAERLGLANAKPTPDWFCPVCQPAAAPVVEVNDCEEDSSNGTYDSEEGFIEERIVWASESEDELDRLERKAEEMERARRARKRRRRR